MTLHHCPLLTSPSMRSWLLFQSFEKTLEVPERGHEPVLPAAASYALTCLTPGTVDPTAPAPSQRGTTVLIAVPWREVLATLLYYIHNVLARPSDASVRRINSGNPALRRRMDSLPLPAACLSPPRTAPAAPAGKPAPRSASVSRVGRAAGAAGAAKAPSSASQPARRCVYQWPALQLLTAAGWVSTHDRWLELPPSVTTSSLSARALELRAALAIVTPAEEAERAAATHALQHTVESAGLLAPPTAVPSSGAASITALTQPRLAGQATDPAKPAKHLSQAAPGGAAVTTRPSALSKPASTQRPAATGTATSMSVPVPLLPLPASSSAAGAASGVTEQSITARAAMSLAAVGPQAAVALLRGADDAISTQQQRVLELEAQVPPLRLRCCFTPCSVSPAISCTTACFAYACQTGCGPECPTSVSVSHAVRTSSNVSSIQ